MSERGIRRASLSLLLGKALVALDRQMEAMSAFREALRIDPSLPTLLFTQANALYELHYTQAALHVLDDALAVRPQWPEALALQQRLSQQSETSLGTSANR